MKARQIIVIVSAIAVVAVIAIWRTGGKDESDNGKGTPKNALKLTFVYSPEKEKLIKPLIKRFNDQEEKVGGRQVHIDGQIVSSGEAQTKIAAKQLKPVIWSPASSLWGRLLNFDADADWAPEDNPSIVRTPLVVAMWEPLARALGWPKKQVGFKQILDLATSKRGWEGYGKPQFGRFKLGHTNPDFSTSGLSAVAAEYFAASGKREGLIVKDVNRSSVRRQIRAIESSIVHYGDTTLFFAEQLQKYGPAFASAVAMEEVTLVDFNRGHKGTKLVGVYPAEGTFFSDNPFIVLNAPWVTSKQKRAAQLFQKFLEKKVTAKVAARDGFRPGEAKKVGDRLRASRERMLDTGEKRVDPAALAPPIAVRLQSVFEQERRIRKAIEKAGLPFEEVSREADVFVSAAERTASRANLLHEYLAVENREKTEQRLAELRSAPDPDPSKRALEEALTTKLAATEKMEKKTGRFSHRDGEGFRRAR